MKSQIALVICIFFIYKIIKIDNKKNKIKESLSIWIPLIWLMYSASKALSYWFNPTVSVAIEFDYTSGSAIDRNFLTFLIFIGIIILIKRKINWRIIFKENIILFIFFLYMLISVSWSPISGVSFKRWFRGLGDLIMALVIITDKDPYKLFSLIIRRCAFILLPLSLILIKYFRYIGVAYSRNGLLEMWVGVTTHKNSLGYLTTVSGVYFLNEIMLNWIKKSSIIQNIKDNLIYIIMLIISIYILFGSPSSRSSTSLGVFLVGVLLITTLSLVKNNIKNARKILINLIIIALFFQLIITYFLKNSIFNIVATAFGKDVTLTGRIPLWDELIRISSDKFLLGSGYASFWNSNILDYLWSVFEWGPTQAHNGYIDLYLNLGIIGIIFFLIIIISSYKKIEKIFIENFVFGKLLLTFLIMIIIYNITEASFVKATSFLWVIFLIISMVSPKELMKKNVSNMNIDGITYE